MRGTPTQARVLAVVREWAPDRAHPDELRRIRGHLRGLAAELVVVSDAGAWQVRADDPIVELDDVFETPRDPAIYVIDGGGSVRFAGQAELPLEAALLAALDTATAVGDARVPLTLTRREWLTSCLVTGFALALPACKEREHRGQASHAAAAPVTELDIVLDINGKRMSLRVEPRVSLLDALRERLGLTGTKKGCDGGQCGACTVLLGQRRVVSCLTLAVMAQNQPITTIEGLEKDGKLHPIQAAFVEHDAMQCGFCTAGQVMSAIALLSENHASSDEEIREQMSGNLCRCGGYHNILTAIRAVRRT